MGVALEVHEVSIAVTLTEAASEKAEQLAGARVEAVHLRVGRLSGVAADALVFSFNLACRGTPLEGSRLVIEEVPVEVFCPTCRTERTLPGIQSFRCPVCGTLASKVIRGTELELIALEVSTNVPPHRRGPAGSPEKERPAGP
jgi:hydrogenase nickel incorporation protein HypA/HybF